MPEDPTSDIHAGNAAGKAGGALKKKIGPLPVWGWAVAGGVGLGIIMFLRNRSTASASSGSLPTQVSTPTQTGPSGTDVLSGQLTDITGQIGALSTQVQQLQPVAGATPSNPGSGSVTAPSGLNSIATQGMSFENTLLGRTGTNDVSGGQFWGERINQGGLLSAFQQIDTSPEAQAFAASNPDAFINGQYQALLGRNADAAGMTAWKGVLEPGGAAPTAATLQAETSGFANAAKVENKGLH
jgi:hypothetical protein